MRQIPIQDIILNILNNHEAITSDVIKDFCRRNFQLLNIINFDLTSIEFYYNRILLNFRTDYLVFLYTTKNYK
jgi:hypothetical protein